MPMCINCGSDKVERQGDAFTCHKCQFQWDVAFEQANKVYLRAQGRQPATSVLENPVKAEGGALTALGQTDGAAVTITGGQVGAVVIPTDTPVATADQHAGDGQSPWAATTSPAGSPAGAPEPPSAAPMSKAAATPAPNVQPPSTPKGKKG